MHIVERTMGTEIDLLVSQKLNKLLPIISQLAITCNPESFFMYMVEITMGIPS